MKFTLPSLAKAIATVAVIAWGMGLQAKVTKLKSSAEHQAAHEHGRDIRIGERIGKIETYLSGLGDSVNAVVEENDAEHVLKHHQ